MWIDNVGMYEDCMYLEQLPDGMYPDLKWEDEPVEVEQALEPNEHHYGL